MPSYDLSSDQEILRRSIRDFAMGEIAPHAAERDEREEFSLELLAKMHEVGLFGMVVSEEYGGSGFDYLSYIIAVEEVARVDGSAAATVAAGNSLGIGPIYYYGTEAQKRTYLPRLCGGGGLASFGLTEPEAGSDAGASKTSAELAAGRWTINGSKIFITNAANQQHTVCTVQAVTGKGSAGRREISCILVPAETPGFEAREMHKKMMWRASNTAELFFTDCQVPEGNLLGARGAGFKQMLETLDSGRLSIAAMGLGGAQGAFELALRYAQERRTFGQPIIKHQAVAFKLADMAMEIEAARNLLYKACWLRDQQRPFGKLAAMAKLYCSEVMGRVVDQAVQVHGGYGLMKEYGVERFYRDQKLLEIGEGTSEVQRIVIARQLAEE